MTICPEKENPMNTKDRPFEYALPVLLLFGLYLTVLIFRPLMPVDETRYMSVAWEMFLRGDWLSPLTVNFQPYHHKPPLLFWMINTCWAFFGVSRWAGTIPVLIAASACVLLTRKLASLLFDDPEITRAAPYVITGNLGFLISSLLIMFDVTLTAFVLLSVIALVLFAKTGEAEYIFWMALAMGLGVLSKGPVAWLYVSVPILTGPLWMPVRMKPLKWYGSCTASILLSALPVLAWLIPVLAQSSSQFGHTLVWDQTFGRVTGRFSVSHSRPIWFYLPFLPVICLPWIFFPSFWKGFARLKDRYATDWAIRFLALWTIPVFVAFSLIKGKQPHYLVPLLPALSIAMVYMMQTSFKTHLRISLAMVSFVILLHGVAALTVFKKFDLEPMVTFLEPYKGEDWLYANKYHGELNFLGRFEKPVDELKDTDTIDAWFKDHPNGIAIKRYGRPDEIKSFNVLFDMPYRGKRVCVVKRSESGSPADSTTLSVTNSKGTPGK